MLHCIRHRHFLPYQQTMSRKKNRNPIPLVSKLRFFLYKENEKPFDSCRQTRGIRMGKVYDGMDASVVGA